MNNNIEVVKGDITEKNYDIIVNAANNRLAGGAGVDGMIHYKAGPELLKECLSLNGCETGKAKMTDSYNLPCKKIIHTVGPIYSSNTLDAPKLLKSCYKTCMELAEKYRVDNNLERITIGFPCISTGIYGYPKEEASHIAIDTIKEINNKNIDVKIVCFEDYDYKLYIEYLTK